MSNRAQQLEIQDTVETVAIDCGSVEEIDIPTINMIRNRFCVEILNSVPFIDILKVKNVNIDRDILVFNSDLKRGFKVINKLMTLNHCVFFTWEWCDAIHYIAEKKLLYFHFNTRSFKEIENLR